jgi:hypothetical protein
LKKIVGFSRVRRSADVLELGAFQGNLKLENEKILNLLARNILSAT